MKTDKGKPQPMTSTPSDTYNNMKSIKAISNACNAKLNHIFYTKAFEAASKKIKEIEK